MSTGRFVRSESGSATVLMTGVIGFVVALSSAALVIAGYAVGYHRARAAADLSALSGAAAYQGGREACPQAERIARQIDRVAIPARRLISAPPRAPS